MESIKHIYRKKEKIVQAIYWIIILLFNFLNFSSTREYLIEFLEPSLFSITFIIVCAVTFYLHYEVVLPRIFKKYNWLKLILGYLISISLFISLRAFVEQYLTAIIFGQINYYPGTFIGYYIVDNVVYSFIPIIGSSAIWIAFYTFRILQWNNTLLEESKKSELKFLRSQINPHFIFNTLNNIYSMVYMKSEKSLQAIEKLSGIMRFTTYDSYKDYVSIDTELSYIRNFIELESLRHEDGIFVNIDISCPLAIKIPPFAISPLIENALKHGVLNDEKNPIQIKLYLEKEGLLVTVKNKIRKGQKDSIGGVGLVNLRKRLEFYYPEISHSTLSIREDDSYFEVTLLIPIK